MGWGAFKFVLTKNAEDCIMDVNVSQYETENVMTEEKTKGGSTVSSGKPSVRSIVTFVVAVLLTLFALLPTVSLKINCGDGKYANVGFSTIDSVMLVKKSFEGASSWKIEQLLEEAANIYHYGPTEDSDKGYKNVNEFCKDVIYILALSDINLDMIAAALFGVLYIIFAVIFFVRALINLIRSARGKDAVLISDIKGLLGVSVMFPMYLYTSLAAYSFERHGSYSEVAELTLSVHALAIMSAIIIVASLVAVIVIEIKHRRGKKKSRALVKSAVTAAVAFLVIVLSMLPVSNIKIVPSPKEYEKNTKELEYTRSAYDYNVKDSASLSYYRYVKYQGILDEFDDLIKKEVRGRKLFAENGTLIENLDMLLFFSNADTYEVLYPAIGYLCLLLILSAGVTLRRSLLYMLDESVEIKKVARSKGWMVFLMLCFFIVNVVLVITASEAITSFDYTSEITVRASGSLWLLLALSVSMMFLSLKNKNGARRSKVAELDSPDVSYAPYVVE